MCSRFAERQMKERPPNSSPACFPRNLPIVSTVIMEYLSFNLSRPQWKHLPVPGLADLGLIGSISDKLTVISQLFRTKGRRPPQFLEYFSERLTIRPG